MSRSAGILLAAIVLAGCSTALVREAHWNPNGTPRDENWHSPSASLLRYDANHDGFLTRAELIAGLKAEFDAYDSGHRNCLTTDQARAINQLRVQQDASQAMPLVDWNQDGCVDLNEYSGAALSLFDSLDTNGDGRLTAAELAPAGHRPGGGGPPGESGHPSGHHHGRGDGDGQ